MKNLIKRALRKLLGIRSPSQEYARAGEEILAGIKRTIENPGEHKPTAEGWAQLQRSADTLTWGDDE